VGTQLRPGVIGLGQIGGGVSRALHRSGFDVIAYDVVDQALSALGEAVTPATSPAAVAELADVVLLAVVDDTQVRDVLSGEDGVLAAKSPPRVVAILSTVSVGTILDAAVAGAAHRVAVIDCGVTGGVRSLEHNAIVTLIGGPDEIVEYARPVFEGFSKPVMHMGPLGAGMRTKIARNAIQWTEWLVAWEAGRLAHAAGIDIERFVEVVRASNEYSLDDVALIESGIGLPISLPRTEMMSQARMEHRIDLGHKDLRAALELGDELGIELRSPALADELLDRVCGGVEAPAHDR
jgi:3-hydroxyisobutyrate dehydrogenase-like beta-hydroxyacid dehydrogenase